MCLRARGLERRILQIFCLLGLCGSVPAGGAEPAEGAVEVGGYVQLWCTVFEQAENGIQQAGTGDLAEQSASGFSLRRARVFARYNAWGDRVTFRVEGQLEGAVGLSDCHVAVRLGEGARLYLGQMKVPSTYEVAEPSVRLDFIEPSTLSARIVDWSLSRTPYISTFSGNASGDRDLGVGLKARLAGDAFRLFAMVGNGLGANLYIGGRGGSEFLYANQFGDFFYGLRLESQPVPSLTLGGHACINRHSDVLFKDGKTVFDLRRRSQSIDVLIELPLRVSLRAMVASGTVDDDYYRDSRTNYAYTGYEGKALAWLVDGALQAGVRYDRYSYERDESGRPTHQDNWTVGLTYHVHDAMRLRLNAGWKHTDEPYRTDLRDNVLLASAQVAF